MIGNGAVAKIVLAVTLGGSAGAISYVGLQHVPVNHGSAPSLPWTSAHAGGAGSSVDPKSEDGSSTSEQTHRSGLSSSGCTHGVAHRSKTGTIVCQADVASTDESSKTAAQGYQPAEASTRSVEAQRVDGASSSQGTGLFKALTDVLP